MEQGNLLFSPPNINRYIGFESSSASATSPSSASNATSSESLKRPSSFYSYSGVAQNSPTSSSSASSTSKEAYLPLTINTSKRKSSQSSGNASLTRRKSTARPPTPHDIVKPRPKSMIVLQSSSEDDDDGLEKPTAILRPYPQRFRNRNRLLHRNKRMTMNDLGEKKELSLLGNDVDLTLLPCCSDVNHV